MFEDLKLLTPPEIAKRLCQYEETLIIDENRPSFCDREILNYRDPYPDLRQLNNLKWIKDSDLFKEKDIKYITYKSVNDSKLVYDFPSKNHTTENFDYLNGQNKLIVYKDIEKEDIRYIMLITNNDYIVVFEHEGHPGIDSNLFNYGNSDGSGPGLLNRVNDWEFSDEKSALGSFFQYYYEFLCDDYH